MKKPNFKRYISDTLPGLTVSLFASFLLFVWAPYELYVTNCGEFWFSAGQMLPMVLLMFAAAFLFCGTVLFAARCAGEKIYAIVFALGLIAAIASYIQGNFLVFGLPRLDKAAIDWGAYPAERIKTVLAWILPALLTVVLIKVLGVKKLQKYSALLCLGLMLVLMLSLAMLFLTTDTDKGYSRAVTDKDMFLMSEEQNFIIFVLDAVDAGEFEKVLDRDPAYRDVFDGFTFYENTLGAYPFSRMSMAYILTGQWYEAQSEFTEYVTEAVDKSEFLNYLNENDYTQNVYLRDWSITSRLDSERFSNVLQDTRPAVGSQAFMAKLLLKMSIIKYAPWDLKFLGYDLLGRISEHRVLDPSLGCDYFDGNNTKFYRHVTESNPVKTVDNKCFKYIHLEGAHEPYNYTKDVVASPEGDYWSSIEASITLTGAYFECLKEAGVYDNSAIIVMADHGYADGGTLINEQQNPILMIKGINERHEFRYNSAPISYADLQQAYLRLDAGAQSEEVFDWQEGDERERRFMIHPWNLTEDIEEYIHTGHASDVSDLVPTGKVYN